MKRLNKMEQTNYKHRKKMSDLKFEELPDPATEPEKIISKGQLHTLSKRISAYPLVRYYLF